MPIYLTRLAEFVSEIRFGDLTEDAVRAAQDVALDTMGAIVAGMREPECARTGGVGVPRRAAAGLRRLGKRPSRQSDDGGSGERHRRRCARSGRGQPIRGRASRRPRPAAAAGGSGADGRERGGLHRRARRGLRSGVPARRGDGGARQRPLARTLGRARRGGGNRAPAPNERPRRRRRHQPSRQHEPRQHVDGGVRRRYRAQSLSGTLRHAGRSRRRPVRLRLQRNVRRAVRRVRDDSRRFVRRRERGARAWRRRRGAPHTAKLLQAARLLPLQPRDPGRAGVRFAAQRFRLARGRERGRVRPVDA